MEQHQHHDYASRDDLNGVGKRVTETEITQGQQEVRIDRNEADIQTIFQMSSNNVKAINSLDKKVEGMLGKVAGVSAAVVALVEIGSKFVIPLIKGQ